MDEGALTDPRHRRTWRYGSIFFVAAVVVASLFAMFVLALDWSVCPPELVEGEDGCNVPARTEWSFWLMFVAGPIDAYLGVRAAGRAANVGLRMRRLSVASGAHLLLLVVLLWVGVS